MAEPTRDDALFPEQKRRYQGGQILNLLLRPIAAPLIRGLARTGLRADLVSLLGLLAYGVGAWYFVDGSRPAQLRGVAFFAAGLFAELIDGGLARLRGPSAVGHFLSKLQENIYVILLLPSMAIGLHRHAADGSPYLLLVGVFGALAFQQVREAIGRITLLHPAETLVAMADEARGGIKRLVIAQFLPDHPSFGTVHRAARVLRENLLDSGGVQPLVLVALVAFDRAGWFVLGFGWLYLLVYAAFLALKFLLLLRGGGRILRTD